MMEHTTCFFNGDSELHERERNHLQLPLNLLFQGPELKQSTRRLMTGHSGKHGKTVCLGSILLGVSQNEVCGTGSLPKGVFRGSVSPKSNFPALLKVALPQKMQIHINWSVSLNIIRQHMITRHSFFIYYILKSFHVFSPFHESFLHEHPHESDLHPIIPFCPGPFEYIEACQDPTIQAGRRHWERQAEARCVGIQARCLLGGVQLLPNRKLFDDCRRNTVVLLHFP